MKRLIVFLWPFLLFTAGCPNPSGYGGATLPDENTEDSGEEPPSGYVQLDELKDPVVKKWVLEKADADRDGKISLAEAAELVELDLSYRAGQAEATSLAGLEQFPNLEVLKADEQGLKELDLSAYANLKLLQLNNNIRLTSLMLGPKPHLEQLSLERVPKLAAQLDISQAPQLAMFVIASAQLKTLDVSANPLLAYFSAFNMTELRAIYISEAQYEVLDERLEQQHWENYNNPRKPDYMLE